MSPLHRMGNVPFDLNTLASIYPNIKHISEKARRFEDNNEIIRLKRGLYIVNAEVSGKSLNRFLIANHIYGPSYISLQTALRHYGLIPEQVHLVQSLTTKHTRSFENVLGCFDYENCAPVYFPIGVRYEREEDIAYLIASPEKALCDLINYSKGINLRFMKDVASYLEDDIRFDMNELKHLDLSVFEACEQYSRKSQNIHTLIKYLKHERHL